MLAVAQLRNRFWAGWVAPNLAVVLLTFGLAIVVMYPFYLLTRVAGRFINLPIYRLIK